jgi:hypothetical protein
VVLQEVPSLTPSLTPSHLYSYATTNSSSSQSCSQRGSTSFQFAQKAVLNPPPLPHLGACAAIVEEPLVEQCEQCVEDGTVGLEDLINERNLGGYTGTSTHTMGDMLQNGQLTGRRINATQNTIPVQIVATVQVALPELPSRGPGHTRSSLPLHALAHLCLTL